MTLRHLTMVNHQHTILSHRIEEKEEALLSPKQHFHPFVENGQVFPIRHPFN